MNAIERLKRDHVLLRAKLNLLEVALAMGQETWFVLRELCHSLARQLQDHIRREEILVGQGRSVLDPQMLGRMHVEHHDEPQRLRTLLKLFVSVPGHSLADIKPVLTDVIGGLRRHMEEEETMLFPVLEQLLAKQPASKPLPESAEPALSETMTVNRILHEHPGAQRVFERLFINVPLEGSDCLDEVAWRHGMEGRELISRLEQALQSRNPKQTVRS